MSLGVWFVLFIIDVLLILLGGSTAYIGAMMTISQTTKLLAAYFGGRAALRDVLSIRGAVVRSND
jgi:hypothetical protein